MMRVVVVGYGPVGARVVEELLPSVARGELAVTVVGQEDCETYNRILLGEYAAGRTSRERLQLTDTQAARSTGIDLRLGTTVTAIDRQRKSVALDDGQHVPYDRLVLAVGARAAIPEMFAAPASPDAVRTDSAPELPVGVCTLRDLADAETIAAAVRDGHQVVILGAGVLGVELALSISDAGGRVVLVHTGETPMARNLDRAGGLLLSRLARRGGVKIVANFQPTGLLTATDPASCERRFTALRGVDHEPVPGDLLVLSTGVQARVGLAVAAGLATSRGILVDSWYRAWSDPAIYAVGDCAHVAQPAEGQGMDGVEPVVAGGPSGLIGPGWRQAEFVAALLCAEAAAEQLPAPEPADEHPPVVIMKAPGMDVVAAGDIQADPWAEGPEPESGRDQPAVQVAPEVSIWADPARRSYLKLVARDGLVDGFIAIGLPRAASELTLLLERRSELPADRSVLLRLDAPTAGMPDLADPFAPDATVCWCNGVKVQRIVEATEQGARTIDAVGSRTRAGTGCGGCRGRITELIARTAAC